jgi:predicted NBD/HSP70 family sugar kinase
MNYLAKSRTASDASQHRIGTNHKDLRNYNERLIIDTIRQSGDVSKADLAKITKLSAQTATIIVNKLLDDDLLRKMKSVKGKVGQPRTPITLNPNGAFSFGVKVGRRSVDIILLDFTHSIIEQRNLRYDYPEPDVVLNWVTNNIKEIVENLPRAYQSRILGIGLAQPFELENWNEIVGAPEGTLESWLDFDLRLEIEKIINFPTYFLNDASSACMAEISQTPENSEATFFYIYIGTFVGGGIAINGKLFEGSSGNAAAIASLPLTCSDRDQGSSSTQINHISSFNSLDLWASKQGYSPEVFTMDPLTPEVETEFAKWCDSAANGLAMAIVSAQAFLDLDFVVIDGSLPTHLKTRVVKATSEAINKYDLRGIDTPTIKAGQLGNDARAFGAALLPLRATFGLESLPYTN